MSNKKSKVISLLLSLCLAFEQGGFAQSIGRLDISGYLASPRNDVTPDKFRPLHLRYLSYNELNNNFKLFFDKGGIKEVKQIEFEADAKTILNYFFIGISLPDDTFWVNLRPDSPDNIIDPFLAKTDIGKILLEADLQLKKDTAQYTSPQTYEGRQYWDRLYKKAGELFGSENVTIPTLTRPWIVPGEIILMESTDNTFKTTPEASTERGRSAYIYKANLKVMLEEDYLTQTSKLDPSYQPLTSNYSFSNPRLKELNLYSTQLIRELIIPKITQEVNASKRYAPLRQVYYSLILAQWFKQSFLGKGGYYSQLINKKNLAAGLTSTVSWSKTTYFKEYQESFKNGEYAINESAYTPSGQVIRSYFSGGIILPKKTAYLQGSLIPSDSNYLIPAEFNGDDAAKREGVGGLELRQDTNYPIYNEHITRIRYLLSVVADKKATRKDISAEIITEILSIQRDGFPVFKQSHAERIARLIKLGERLSLLEHLISYLYQSKQGNRNKFLFNGTHIAPILRSTRGEAEIKGLITALRYLGINEGNHISLILESSRGETEIKRLIGVLKELGITQNTHIASILHSSRKEIEIKRLIETLEGLGITESNHKALILQSSRGETEIKDLIAVLRKLRITEGYHISLILHSARGETEIKDLITILEKLEITEGYHISLILQSSRSEAEIKGLIATLNELEITKGAHISQILQSSRGEAEIKNLIAILKGLGVDEGTHIASILHSSRGEAEIKRLIGVLEELGITKGTHIALILQSSRGEAEIKDLTMTLRDLGIRENHHIALILQSSRGEAEIKDLTMTLRGLGIRENYHIALILHSSQDEEEIKKLTTTLRGLGIRENYHIAMILHSSRTETEIKRLIGVLKELGITKGTHIALILHSSRTETEIKRLIEALKELGITKGTHIALILHSSRGEIEIKRLIGVLKELGITEGTNISQILYSSRTEAEINKLIELKKVIAREKSNEYPEQFIKNMFVSFASIDNPAPLLNKIMKMDLNTIKLEIEQLPVNTTREQFERKYGDMSIWILRFWGDGFTSLRSVIRGYAKERLLFDIIPEAENIIAAPENTENNEIKEMLAETINGLDDEEQKVIEMFLAGYLPGEIYIEYPNTPLSNVLDKLKENMVNDYKFKDYIEPFYNPNVGGATGQRTQAAIKSSQESSSALAIEQEDVLAVNKKGGVDFRTLSNMAHPINIPELNLKVMPIGKLDNIDIDSEWSEIRNMLNANIIPSAQRIKEYFEACYQENRLSDELNSILNCIAEIMRIEEERALATAPELRNLLILANLPENPSLP